MKNLVIVESPSKSKTIEKYLGKDYKVVSSKGHIRDLAIKGKDGLGVDVENDFKPTYVVSKDKKDVVKELKANTKKAEKVYLATDPDREGEAISWHLAQELGLDLDEVTFDFMAVFMQYQKAINEKDTRAIEFIRDTLGQKPANQVEVKDTNVEDLTPLSALLEIKEDEKEW